MFMKLSFNYKANIIETVCGNRKHMPKDLYTIKLKGAECAIKSCNRILSIKWKDKGDIYIIMTKHETVEMTTQGSNRT